MPIFWPATMSGASEELPLGTHFLIPSFSSISCVSLVSEHSTAEPRVATTPLVMPIFWP